MWRRTAGLLLGVLALHLAACGTAENDLAPPTHDSGRSAVRVATSESALPLMNLLAREAMRADPTLRLHFLPPTHSAGAVAATGEGEADLGVLSRVMTADEQRLGLQYLHFARDGLVFVTSEGVGVRNLTGEQLRGIYSGEITNWKDVGGVDGEIVVLDRPEHTSPKIVLRELLFGPDLKIVDGAIILDRPTQMVVSLGTMQDAIGYAALPEVLAANLDATVLSLDGVAPTPQNIEDNLYPLSRQIGLVIQPSPSRDVMKFIDFAHRDTGQRLMRAHGYSPMLMTLVVATIPERIAIRQEGRYRPLVEYLARRFGDRTTIRLKHLPSYEVLVDELMRGGVNSAFVGSFTYTLAHANVGVEAVARPETAGNSWYRGLILVRKDSGIDSWRDLKGKSFAMIRDTTAGDIFPRVFLKRHGIDDHEKFLGDVVYAGTHDTSIRKVLSGEVDAGAAKDLVFALLAAEDPRVNAELRVLAESMPVPENALVIRRDAYIACISCHQKSRGVASPARGGGPIDLDLAARLRKELLELDQTAEGRAALAELGADRFVETSDADYANLYVMIEELGLDLTRR